MIAQTTVPEKPARRPVRPPWALLAMLGALLCGTSVLLGAFGSHALKPFLVDRGATSTAEPLATWEIGARYQMYHGLALLFLAVVHTRTPRRSWVVATVLFLLGCLLFSGCLYAWVLTGIPVWVRVVPVGGVLLLAGWAAVVVGLARSLSEPVP